MENPVKTALKPAAVALAAAVLLLTSGCAGLRGTSEGGYYGAERPSAAMAPAPKAMKSVDRMAEPSAEAASGDYSYSDEESRDGGSPVQQADTGQTAQNTAARERKHVYSGSSRIMTDNIEQRKKDIIALAEESGGYLESVYALNIAVRVPAEKFHNLFERILTFGEVLYKAVETYDVTEAYTDLDSRLSVLQQSRDRLSVLLEKTDDVKERIRILKEIRRLDEEIERLKSTLAMLDRQIAFSRISVELVSRTSDTSAGERTIPFEWIAELNPLSGSIGRLSGKVSLDPGSDFAVFEKEAFYRAEAPDGTRIRIGTTDNRPEGSAEFWQKALIYNLKSWYRTAEPVRYGKISGVMFTGKDIEPYSYFVGVFVSGKQLHVIEVFYPDREAKNRHEAAVTGALGLLEMHP